LVMVHLLRSFLQHFSASCMGMEIPCQNNNQLCNDNLQRTTATKCNDNIQQTTATVEFAVNMTCGSCERAVRDSLQHLDGIHSIEIDVPQQSVVIRTTQPTTIIQEALERTGMLAVLRGQGGTGHMGAAVSILRDSGVIKGLVRFTQVAKDRCVVDGSFTGLTPGKHGLHIHELGDLSDGWRSTGECFNPHGGQQGESRLAGDLENITVDEDGASSVRYVDDLVKVWDIIGRSVVVHEREDDGSGSEVCGGAGAGVACGIVARSSGLFENKKMVCTCSGQTIWEERENVRQGLEL